MSEKLKKVLKQLEKERWSKGFSAHSLKSYVFTKDKLDQWGKSLFEIALEKKDRLLYPLCHKLQALDYNEAGVSFLTIFYFLEHIDKLNTRIDNLEKTIKTFHKEAALERGRTWGH